MLKDVPTALEKAPEPVPVGWDAGVVGFVEVFSVVLAGGG